MNQYIQLKTQLKQDLREVTKIGHPLWVLLLGEKDNYYNNFVKLLENGHLYELSYLVRDFIIINDIQDKEKWLKIADEVLRIQYVYDNTIFQFYNHIESIFSNYHLTIKKDDGINLYEIFLTHIYFNQINKDFNYLDKLNTRLEIYLCDNNSEQNEHKKTVVVKALIDYFRRLYNYREQHYKYYKRGVRLA